MKNIQIVLNELKSSFTVYGGFVEFPNDFDSVFEKFRSEFIKVKRIVDANTLLHEIEKMRNDTNVYLNTSIYTISIIIS